MIIFSLIFYIYAKTADKNSRIGAQVLLPRYLTLDFIRRTLGNKRSLNTIVRNGKKGHDLSDFSAVVNKTIGLTKAGFGIKNGLIMKEIFQIVVTANKRKVGELLCETGKFTLPEEVKRECGHLLFGVFDDNVARTFHHLPDRLFQLLRNSRLFGFPFIGFCQRIETIGCGSCEYGDGFNCYGHNTIKF